MRNFSVRINRCFVLIGLVLLIFIRVNAQATISVPAYKGEIKINSAALPVLEVTPFDTKSRFQNNFPNNEFSILTKSTGNPIVEPSKYFCSTPNYRRQATDKFDIKAVGSLDCGTTRTTPCYWTKPFVMIGFINGTPELKQAVREAAAEWTTWANVGFVAQDNDAYEGDSADIKIYFTAEDVYNSFVGVDAWHSSVRKGKKSPTMNLGFLGKAIRLPTGELLPWVKGTILHEFGHALGLQHEHQNPAGGIKWNREAVVADLSRPPNNWQITTIENNIFRGLSRTRTQFTQYDASSIMHYSFPAEWTQNNIAIPENYTLSETDKSFIASNYPRKKTVVNAAQYYRLTPWNSNQKSCLGISSRTASGTTAYFPYLVACDNSSAGQLWKLTPIGTSGDYRLTNSVTGNQLSLDDAGLDDGTEMRKTGNYSGQHWSVTSLGKYNRLTSSYNGALYSLTSPLAVNARLFMYKTAHWSNQLWEFIPAGKVQ